MKHWGGSGVGSANLVLILHFLKILMGLSANSKKMNKVSHISVCRKLCNSWHSFLRLPHIPFVWGIRKFNPIAPQLPKIEAIQTSLFVDVLNAFSAMIGPLPAAIRFRIVRLLLLHWQPVAIAEEVHCCSRTVYSMLENIFMYSSPFKPQFRPKGGPKGPPARCLRQLKMAS